MNAQALFSGIGKLVQLGAAYVRHVQAAKSALAAPEQGLAELAQYLRGLSESELSGFKVSVALAALQEKMPASREALQWLAEQAELIARGTHAAGAEPAAEQARATDDGAARSSAAPFAVDDTDVADLITRAEARSDAGAQPREPELTALAVVLRDKVLRKQSNNFDRDYSGGSSYSERTEAIYLCGDGSFRYEISSFSTVSAGGMTFSTPRSRERFGEWKIDRVAGQPALVLIEDGEVTSWWHTRDGGTGVQYLDGVAWERYRIQ